MSKAKVAIVVDSTACLPPHLLQQHHIEQISLHLNWQGQTYFDLQDITPDQFYKELPQASSLPNTSQPSVGEFLECFKKVAERAESIVAILISKELSGTVASAQAAAQELSHIPIEVIDSQSSAMGLGLLALTAAKLARQGQSHQEIAHVLRAMVPQTRVLFVVDTLEYLHKGGRIGGAKRLLGSILSIKPILHLKDGKIEALASVRTKKKAVARLVDIVSTEKKVALVSVIHAAAEAEAQEIAAELSVKFPQLEIISAGISPVIGAHVGPGAVGVAYYLEK